MRPRVPSKTTNLEQRAVRPESWQRIADASAQLFAERGFDSVSIRDIADLAGVNGGSIYNYFGDKRALYDLVLGMALEKQTLEQIAVVESAGTARVRLRDFLLNIITSLTEQSVEWRLLERMFNDSLDWALPMHGNILVLRFQADIKAITEELVPGAHALPWAEISGIINGIPHGLTRSRRLHGRLEGEPLPLESEVLADLLVNIVIAAIRAVVESRANATPRS